MLKHGCRKLAFMVGFAMLIPALHAAEYPSKTIQIINPFPPGALIPIINKNSAFMLKDFAPLTPATSSPTTVVKGDAP